MVTKILFIEGTTDATNGDLRQGFNKLLSKKLAGNMPRIIMGNDTRATIDKFLHNTRSDLSFLLIDLDGNESDREEKLEEYGLENHEGYTFFMIQAMEAWFLSQPEILDDFYGDNISSKIPQKRAEEITRPAKFLQDITRNTKKKRYHKVKHGVQLLQKLDANKLEQTSLEFADLIKKLRGKEN